MPPGREITATGTAGGWVSHQFNGQTGWSHPDYLDLAKNGSEQVLEPNPATGSTIQAVIVRKNWLGDGKDKALDCGQFQLDDAECAGPPSQIVIKATSLSHGTGVRQTEKSRAWEAVDLKTIAGQMASESGMTLMYESAQNPRYSRVEQTRVTDIAFLKTLCNAAGISLKATNNILVLFDQAAFESKPAAIKVRRGDGTYKSWKLRSGSAGTRYNTCRVSYLDPATGRVIEATAHEDTESVRGSGDRQLEIKAKVSDAAEAEQLAEKYLRLHNKYALTAEFTFPGNPDLLAGMTAEISGWGAWSGKYIISQAVHSVGGGGYDTKVCLRPVLA